MKFQNKDMQHVYSLMCDMFIDVIVQKVAMQLFLMQNSLEPLQKKSIKVKTKNKHDVKNSGYSGAGAQT